MILNKSIYIKKNKMKEKKHKITKKTNKEI